MQGTIVMMLALSGLGCHHKKCCVDYVAPCYSVSYSAPSGQCYGGMATGQSYASAQSYGGCYGGPVAYVAPACYTMSYGACYGGGCYGGASYSACYGGCYGGGCYGAVASCAPKHHKGFGCFGHKRRVYDVCCGDMGSTLPVYGSYTPVYQGPGGQMVKTTPPAATSMGGPPPTTTTIPDAGAGATMPDTTTTPTPGDTTPPTPTPGSNAPSTAPPAPSPGSPPNAA